jgi:histidinol dehydrogenase
VGIYVPGGKAAYPSSVLMNAIPAHVAGVGDIIMVVPTPGREEPAGAGRRLCGRRDRAFTIGGAQAVAALAYGTATVPKVDKITGPGNAYVASAKRRVFGIVGIDMIAGPSEILVLADGAPPDWVAMDLFSQAEHDELAQSILLCPDAAYIDRAAPRSTACCPPCRAGRDHRQPEGRGALIHTAWKRPARSATASRPSTWKSPAEPHRWEPLLKHAGAIFLGAYTSESLGDYCAGPNHVLPLGHGALLLAAGRVRLPEALQPDRGQRRRRQILGKIAAELAYGEGLQGHARAAELRLKNRAERGRTRRDEPLLE